MDRRRFLARSSQCVVVVAGAACTSVERSAAGYRRRGVRLRPLAGENSEHPATRETLSIGGHELRFDPEIRVYRVVGRPDHFYLGGWFYRRTSEVWQRARSLCGDWIELAPRGLPPGLRRSSSP